jgi:transposase-like protein
MTNRIRQLDEKVQSVMEALEQINVEAAARKAGVPASTLRYDLKSETSVAGDSGESKTGAEAKRQSNGG